MEHQNFKLTFTRRFDDIWIILIANFCLYDFYLLIIAGIRELKKFSVYNWHILKVSRVTKLHNN